jgi:hypothetical protein
LPQRIVYITGSTRSLSRGIRGCFRLSASFACAALLLAALLTASALTAAEKLPATSAGAIAAALEPYLENHTLAGAVTLIAGKDTILGIETVGFADIAAKKPVRPTRCSGSPP